MLFGSWACPSALSKGDGRRATGGVAKGHCKGLVPVQINVTRVTRWQNPTFLILRGKVVPALGGRGEGATSLHRNACYEGGKAETQAVGETNAKCPEWGGVAASRKGVGYWDGRLLPQPKALTLAARFQVFDGMELERGQGDGSSAYSSYSVRGLHRDRPSLGATQRNSEVTI